MFLPQAALAVSKLDPGPHGHQPAKRDFRGNSEVVTQCPGPASVIAFFRTRRKLAGQKGVMVGDGSGRNLRCKDP